MNVIWITATLLSRGLLAVAETEKCPDMPIHRITPGANVSVRCPNTMGTEVKFELWKDKCKVGSVTRKQNQTETEGAVDFRDQDQNTTARFVLSQVDRNSTGIFACNAERLYPPPYLKSSGVENMVVVNELPQVRACPQEKPTEAWIWAALGVTAAYSLIMTGIAVGLWHYLKNKQNIQHDYMNMKPKAVRKKQGVQHPVRTGRY
ncbi:uncharacterized protein si:dkey-1h24.6 [Anguilla rostrata]|uniref:uncharacterized protein si:dkey-1h24.6 n=1 Tax=Anguilla rostrata TaxID=7938 RepID=UPI0030D47487